MLFIVNSLYLFYNVNSFLFMSIENKDSYRVGITPNEKEKIEILTSRNNFINAVAWLANFVCKRI